MTCPNGDTGGSTVCAIWTDGRGREYLDDLEALHLAEQRLKDIHEGKSQTVPFEKVMKEHGLAD